MSDAVVLAGFGFLGTIVTAVSAYAMARLSKMEQTGEKTHALVNSNMGVQLELNAVSTRRLAELTKNKADIEAAAVAQDALKEHQRKQVIADQK